MRYSASLQRDIVRAIVLPSSQHSSWRTKMVFRWRAALQILVETTPFRTLWLGALSRGMEILHSRAEVRTWERALIDRDANFCGPGNASGSSVEYPISTCSSLRSFRRQPVWLLILTNLTWDGHGRSALSSCSITSKCTIFLGCSYAVPIFAV